MLVAVFSQYLKNIEIPFPGYSREKGMHITRFPLFRLFPVSSNNELQTLLSQSRQAYAETTSE